MCENVSVDFCYVQKGITARVEMIAEGHVIIELVRNGNFSYCSFLLDVD